MSENERLKEVQKVLGFRSQKEFAEKLNIQQGSLSDIYRGKPGVGVSNSIKRILELEYSINIKWLETGKGEMKKEEVHLEKDTDNPKVSGSLEILAKAIETLSESEKKNTQNIQELIAQGREQTNNITKLVDLLCKSGILTDILTDSEKRGQSSGKDTDDNTASIAGNADVG